MHKGMAFGVKLDYIFYAQGILSASVLSIIPLIRPYRWQSLLMPVWFHFNLLIFFFFLFLGQVISSMNLQVLPDDMLDFLDAPVPYIVSDFLFFCRFPHS